jgi:hypothetical protein
MYSVQICIYHTCSVFRGIWRVVVTFLTGCEVEVLIPLPLIIPANVKKIPLIIPIQVKSTKNIPLIILARKKIPLIILIQMKKIPLIIWGEKKITLIIQDRKIYP